MSVEVGRDEYASHLHSWLRSHHVPDVRLQLPNSLSGGHPAFDFDNEKDAIAAREDVDPAAVDWVLHTEQLQRT